MKKLLATMLMFVFAVVLVACGGGNEPVSIQITPGGPIVLDVGDTVQLTAKVLPEGADQSVTWSSVNDSVASVSDTGLVTGVSHNNTIIRATSTVDDEVFSQVTVRVQADADAESRPDLGGMTITIAQSDTAIYEIDPFHDDYVLNDKEARQAAFEWVMDAYNVEIEIVAYPQEYVWGPPRWEYLINQAASNISDYDFIIIPDDRVGMLVEGNVLIDISQWYAAYGDGYMDPVYRQSGSYKGGLYSITEGTAGIYNVLYYNINLVESLGLEEPAAIFNRNEWTYSEFLAYAEEAQTVLGAGQYALTGNPAYYWIGMLNAGGIAAAEPATLTLNIDHEYAVAAAETIKSIYTAGAFDPGFNVDQHTVSWNEGNSLFTSGDLWFVNNDTRWPADLWGEGDLTRYGYVPWPRPDEIANKDDQGIAAGGTATYAMPIGRDSYYAQFGEEATSENVYRALIDIFHKTEEFLEAMPTQDEDALRLASAQRFTSSDASIDAYLYMVDRFEHTGFFDPMSLPTNAITNMWAGGFPVDMRLYVRDDIESYGEIVETHRNTLQEALTNAYA